MNVTGSEEKVSYTHPPLTKAFDTLKEDVEHVLKSSEWLIGEVNKLLANIEDMAASKYPEGDDYHGGDYLSQNLDHKWKTYIQGLRNRDWDLWNMPDDLKALREHLSRIYRDLRDEYS